MKFKRNFTLSRAKIKEKIKPADRKFICDTENVLIFFARSSTVAASMVGMARRKENSTIVFLFNPSIRPPIIVAAERDTPGTMAIDWKRPMSKRVL
jgi:hypothetical protein